MPCDDVALGVYPKRNVKAKRLDATGNLRDLRVRMAPGILGVRGELSELPVLDPLGHCLRKHASPSDTSKWRCLSEGALCAGLSNRASMVMIIPSAGFVQYLQTF